MANKLNNRLPTVLIVDDELINRVILCELFKDSYNVLEAENGVEGLKLIRDRSLHIALVLLDIIMPIMDGFEVLKAMKEEGIIEHIPVIMITAEKGDETAVKGYEYGVSDFINKPFNADIVQHRSKIIIELNEHRNNLEDLLSKEMAVVEEQKVKLEKTNDFVIDALSTIVEFRHNESGTHVKRVRGLTKVILQEVAKRNKSFGLTPERIELLSKASTMHDLGKVAIPDSVLDKPGRLTPEEFELMKRHTTLGAEILETIEYDKEDEFFAASYDIVRHHHERWDGRGYPDKLAGYDISIGAQAVSLADVYDALTNNRVYKPAFSHEEAVAMIVRGECGTFNPLIIECLLTVADNLHKLVEDALQNTTTKVRHNEKQEEDTLAVRTVKVFEKERAKQQIISDLSGEIIFEYNYENDALTVSEKALKVLGIPSTIPNFKKQFSHNKLIAKNDIEKIFFILKALNQQNPDGHVEVKINTVENGQRWYDIKFSVLFSATSANTEIVGRLLDVDEIKTKYENLKEDADFDSLTGVYNRHRFIDMLDTSILVNKELTGYLLFIDIDNFKKINDNYGHLVGDEVLVQSSQDIRQKIRDKDIICRYGGDEFVIYIQNITRENLENVLKRLCFSTCNIQGKSNVVTKSIGVSAFPADGKTYQELLNKADIAMYQAKNRSKARFIFYSDIN
jgi:putative two-component system response regulator